MNLLNFGFISMNIPKWYENTFLNVALADPTVIDLRSKNENYYFVGNLLSNRLKNLHVASSINDIFFERFKKLMKLIIHMSSENNLDSFTKKLTN